jgi:hypothetical protein
METLCFIMSLLKTISYHSNINSKVTNRKKAIVKEIHLLLCRSCFWCASYFSMVRIINAKCPSCNNYDKLESMPISYDEVYKFDYDQKRGIMLEFSKKL